VAQWANSYAAPIDPNIVSRVPIDAPISDRLQKYRRQDNSLAAVFTMLTALNFSASETGCFTEGMCPPDLSPDKEKCAVVKKSMGWKAGLTDVALTATIGAPRGGLVASQLDGKKFANEKALLVNLLYQSTRESEEWHIIRGNNTGCELNGLETDVQCCCDLSCGSITKAFLDQQIMLMLAVGVKPTAVYAHPMIIDAINQAYMTVATYTYTQPQGSDQATLGVYGNKIVTPAGVLPLVSDHRFTMDNMGSGTFCGDIFIMTEMYRGQPVLYMHDQIPISYLDLARAIPYCTSEQFFVWQHTALVNRSCPDPSDVCDGLHRRICDVGISISCGDVPVPTVLSYY
jgi:hypothetical protein